MRDARKNFSWVKKKKKKKWLEPTSEIFSKNISQKYFPRVEIDFRRAGKTWFCQERPGELKSYAKNFDKKTNNLWIS